jgi:hypothetical protein
MVIAGGGRPPPIMCIEDVHMPLFVLGVFYVGLFLLLGDNKRKEQ